jgi:hypothetical protein
MVVPELDDECKTAEETDMPNSSSLPLFFFLILVGKLRTNRRKSDVE